MSTRPRTRRLCTHCFESFSLDSSSPESFGGGPEDPDAVCPSCVDRAHRRARGAGGDASPSGTAPTTTESPPGPAPVDPARAPLLEESLPPAATVTESLLGHLKREGRAAAEWCEGRMPWFRLLLWLYLAGTFVRHLGSSEPYRSLFDGLNLGIHEFGHALFRPLGEWWHIAGGTLTQLAVPIASLFIFRRQRDYFGISVGLCWLATNLWGVSIYMGDARALRLPLVAPGMGMMPGGDSAGGIIHDWNYLLGSPGLLKYDTIFAGLLATGAVVVMGLGLALGAWLIVRMIRSDADPKIDFDQGF